MAGQRYLIVIADDYGIGPATSQGILELGLKRVVTGTVLMVNSPYAAEAISWWRKANRPMEMGWHPVLTVDPPILGAEKVPSLVGPDRCFWPLGKFLKRLYLGKIKADEIKAEMKGQYERYRELVGSPPTIVNTHQHVGLFGPVGPILLDVLRSQRERPYVRRVREPLSMLAKIPGARVKRAVISWQGRTGERQQQQEGFPGNRWLAGITDPAWVKDSQFFSRWLGSIPGDVVELACHPGYLDRTLVGRDSNGRDGLIERRLDEFNLLNDPGFSEIVRSAGFESVSPGEWQRRRMQFRLAA